MSTKASIPPPPETVLDHDDIGRAIKRIASAIVEQTKGGSSIALVGIREGGVPLSNRIASEIQKSEGVRVPIGTIEIALYRDDVASRKAEVVGSSDIRFAVDGQDVVLVDDVVHTGRTVRAAIDALLDYGRPRRIWLAALTDRGGRELPIAPDFVGLAIDVPAGGYLEVTLGGPKDRVVLVRPAFEYAG
ncbi:MAG: bifunctional pyr operon transcriptional regulator/uracil phosphoribosyltransferase PyrR [Polyangiales bacterium]